MLVMSETLAEAIKKKIKKEFPNSNVKVESIDEISEDALFYNNSACGHGPIKIIKSIEVDVRISGLKGLFFDDLQDISGYHVVNAWLGNVGLIIDKVIFNDPATIVYWKDGTKTVVKCDENEEFDPEKGLAMAISKKALGNNGNYYNTIKKWLPEPDVIVVVVGPREMEETDGN